MTNAMNSIRIWEKIGKIYWASVLAENIRIGCASGGQARKSRGHGCTTVSAFEQDSKCVDHAQRESYTEASPSQYQDFM